MATTKNKLARKAIKTDFGLVMVTGGEHVGRVGIYDSDDTPTRALVCFSPLEYVRDWNVIPRTHLREVTTEALIARNHAIFRKIGFKAHQTSIDEIVEILAELLLVDNALGHRMVRAQTVKPGANKRVFISHSSKDKQFARWLAVDLANGGYVPWLDEWIIRVGDSIPTKIGEGLQECDALIVVLSAHSVASRWVEREWQAKYSDELLDGRIRVLPVLLEDCNVPALLKMKRYADFRDGFTTGIDDLLTALSCRTPKLI